MAESNVRRSSRIASRARTGKESEGVQDTIGPQDSASQTRRSSLTASSIEVRRLELSARKASLLAEASLAEERQRLELEEVKLRQKKEELDLRSKLAAINAEEEVFAVGDIGEEDGVDVIASPHEVELDNQALHNTGEFTNREDVVSEGQALNPLAKDFRMTPSGEFNVLSLMKQNQAHNAQMVELLRLPTAQLIPFSGDPLKYWPFIRSFEANVASCTVDDGVKLTRLIHYCTGQARKVVECCAVLPPAAGYKRARELLKDRFGNDYLVLDACIQKITQGVQIKAQDKARLQEFSDDLIYCSEMWAAMGISNELNNQTMLLKIVCQLPIYLQNRWRHEVRLIRERTFRSPDINDLVAFVRGAAIEANDPVYGQLTEQHHEAKSKQTTVRKRRDIVNANSSSFVLSASDADGAKAGNAVVCPLCDSKDHRLYQCSRFKGMSTKDRTALVKQKRLCFNCLIAGHQSKRCKLNKVCNINGCGKKHSVMLHISQPSEIEPEGEVSSATSTTVTTQAAVTGNVIGAGVRRSALPIVPVVVINPSTGAETITCALLDSGSTSSFCSQGVADRLMLDGQKETLALTTIEAEGASVCTTKVCLQVASLDHRNVVDLPCVYTRKELPINIDNRAKLKDIRQWQHLRGIELPEVDGEKVCLLIGQDCPEAIMPMEVRRGVAGSPFAVRTVLGWTINGPVHSHNKQPVAINYIQSDLQRQVERFWRLEGICDQIEPESDKCFSVDDKRALKVWKDSIWYDEGHYSLDIPFKDEIPRLPDNLSMARQRLRSLHCRLNRDKCLHEMYNLNMEVLLNKSYAEAVSENEVHKPEGTVWYLPHHPVFNKNKPGKVRIVFDCAAVYQGTSLNNKVLQGPDLTSKLIGVLLRFRLERFAVMADIESMFHQVRVNRHHRDYLRFLWWPNGDIGAEVKMYRMKVHLFGGVWSPSCCNFALRHTAKQHATGCSKEVVEAIDKNFYVDDFLRSFASIEQAKSFIEQLNCLVSKGGFRLTKWISNCDRILSGVPENERSSKDRDYYLPDVKLSERALGVKWDIESDKFTFSVVDKGKPATRRGILSVISSVFDPLGLCSPFMLPAKRLLQELCRKGIGWDDNIPEAELIAWQAWQQDHLRLQDLKVDRCVKPSYIGETVLLQLHHFCDASRDGYGTASYLRVVDKTNKVSCQLLMAKSRLAPIKSTTIPRLELQAATLAAKMDELLRNELDISSLKESVFWTDSTVVLSYLNSTNKRFHTFVANRISVIHDRTRPSQWRYVSTDLNPADDASRGLRVDELIGNNRWFNGPDFLLQNERAWPTKLANVGTLSDTDPEVRKDHPVYTALTERDIFDAIFTRRSSWYKLKKDIAWFLRARSFLRNRIKGVRIDIMNALSVAELDEAEIQAVKLVQRRVFPKEFSAILESSERAGYGRKRSYVTKASSLYKLEPLKLKDGLLRVGGRLPTHPVILPKRHIIVDLIVQHFHIISGHAGREHVLALVREKYWIIGARSAVRRVLKDCNICKIQRATPMVQRMADLPSDRITPGQPPFTSVGVDLFGPFTVKRGRSLLKKYGCLFTCLVIRAIHIEVVESLETDSFLNALQRFICRRGQVRTIRCDNGTNFVGAANELHKATAKWNHNRIQDFLCQKSIEWRFNPPAASHMGGAWERQIRSIRKVLCTLMKQQTLSEESLTTLMCIVESIVNGRPLTTVSSDHRDLEPLTPNHLLLLRAEVSMPAGEFVKQDLYSRKRWRQVQYLADVFWRRWTREYLPTLQLRQKWTAPTRNVEVGDVVIIADDNAPRNSWLLGRVEETFPASDGFVRSAKVSTRTSTLIRPIHKLCLLETASER